MRIVIPVCRKTRPHCAPETLLGQANETILVTELIHSESERR